MVLYVACVWGCVVILYVACVWGCVVIIYVTCAWSCDVVIYWQERGHKKVNLNCTDSLAGSGSAPADTDVRPDVIMVNPDRGAYLRCLLLLIYRLWCFCLVFLVALSAGEHWSVLNICDHLYKFPRFLLDRAHCLMNFNPFDAFGCQKSCVFVYSCEETVSAASIFNLASKLFS